MNIENLEKTILNGEPSTSSDFSAQAKKRIYTLMESKGMSQGTAYNRFFRDGFSKWELMGIRGVIDHYLKDDTQTTPVNYTTFYSQLENKSLFKEYMAELGMCADTTAARFSSFNFKEWELEGIKHTVLNNLYDV